MQTRFLQSGLDVHDCPSPTAGLARKMIQPQLAGLLQPGESMEIRVTGNCMAPLLCDGQRVKVRRQRRYYPGDVIVFSDIHGNPLIHRLLGWAPSRSGMRVMAKADAAYTIDVLVPAEWIVGRVRECSNGNPVRIGVGSRARAWAHYAAWSGRLLLRKMTG